LIFYFYLRYGSKLRSEIQYALMNFLILDLRERELILFRTNFERSDREREIGIYSLESATVKCSIDESCGTLNLQNYKPTMSLGITHASNSSGVT